MSSVHLVSGPTMTVGSGSCDVQQQPCGTSLIFDSIDGQNLNKQVNHVIQF